LIIFDASALVSAALKADSVPERALLRAEEVDVFALSAAVDGEIAGVLNRPRFARAIPLARRERVLEILRHAAVWFEPTVRVTDCRDPKDNKYLELALAAGAETIVSSDDNLLVFDPWRGVRIMRPPHLLGTGCDEAVHVILDLMLCQSPLHGHAARDAYSSFIRRSASYCRLS
jgi:putative PIN family toxin of toxin-antitoxin system